MANVGNKYSDAFLGTIFDKMETALSPLVGIADRFSSVLTSLASTVDRVVTATTRFSAPMLAVGNAMTRVTETAFQPLTSAINLFHNAATGVISTMRSFVEKANPAAAFQFTRAMDDLAATMGQILEPVFEAVTHVVRTMADVFQGLRPVLEPLMKALGQIIEQFGRLIEPLASVLAPILQAIGWIVEHVVAPALKALVDAFTWVVNKIKALMRELGFSVPESLKRDSTGAAVRSPSYAGGNSAILDIGNRTTLEALKAGMPKNEEERKTEEHRRKIEGQLDQIRETIKEAKRRGVMPDQNDPNFIKRWLAMQASRLEE